MSDQDTILRVLFDDAVRTIGLCSSYGGAVRSIGDRLIECFESGGRLLVCGNGGSSADAAHFAAELSVRFEMLRRPLPAICLGAAAAELTALGNDFDFGQTFQRLVLAHGKAGDCLFVISTSGNSENILAALKQARISGLGTLSLLGQGGGHALGLADIELVAPGGSTARVQEAQQVFIHAICALLDRHFAD